MYIPPRYLSGDSDSLIVSTAKHFAPSLFFLTELIYHMYSPVVTATWKRSASTDILLHINHKKWQALPYSWQVFCFCSTTWEDKRSMVWGLRPSTLLGWPFWLLGRNQVQLSFWFTVNWSLWEFQAVCAEFFQVQSPCTQVLSEWAVLSCNVTAQRQVHAPSHFSRCARSSSIDSSNVLEFDLPLLCCTMQYEAIQRGDPCWWQKCTNFWARPVLFLQSSYNSLWTETSVSHIFPGTQRL